MEAVKMPGTTQVKSQIRTASADASKGGDEFMKLLQVKKDQVQPNQTDAKKTDDKGGKKDVDDISDSKKDDSQDTVEENVPSEDTGEQDVLLQAVMQQAAAQAAGIVTEQEKEPVKVGDGNEIPAETVSLEEGMQQQTKTEVKEPAEQAVQEPTQNVEKPEQKKEPDASADNKGEENQDYGFKTPAREAVSEKEPEVQPYKVQTEAKPQTEEKTDTHESIYAGTSARTETEHGFAVRETETVPLKTSQDTLPQDLGRTLADTFSGAGRELVVELEPANLGKLTIKMVYEAGKAAVSIMATNPRTLEILNQKAAEIAGILEEKTGQETIIYTQEAQQENQEENPDGNQGRQGDQGRQGGRRQPEENNRHDAESFVQQLRLGLV